MNHQYPGKDIITAVIATTCIRVLILPGQLAAIISFSLSKKARFTVINNSRVIITNTIHNGILSSSKIKPAMINNLSAIGSKSVPSGVISLCLRARYPSSTSEVAVIAKTTAAIKG